MHSELFSVFNFRFLVLVSFTFPHSHSRQKNNQKKAYIFPPIPMGRMRNRSGNSAMCDVCKWIEQPAQQSQCKPLAAAQSQQLTDRSGQNDDDAMGNLRAADDSHLAMQCVCRGGTLKWVSSSSSNFPTATSKQQQQHRSSNCNITAATSWLFRPPTPFIINRSCQKMQETRGLQLSYYLLSTDLY